MRRIKVAIDSGPLISGHAVRGIGVMVKEQILSLKKHSKSDVVIDSIDFSSEEGRGKLERGNYDIAHYTLFFPYAVTVRSRKLAKKVIVTIQDLIHLIYPDKYPPGIRGKLNFLIQKQRLGNVDRVITVSECSKKDIVRLLGYPSEKIDVSYLAPKDVFKKIKLSDKSLKRIKVKYNLPDKFVLFVGDINYNKNISTLIAACEIAHVPLVLIGKQAKEIENTEPLSLMNLSGPQDWIRFLFNKPHPEVSHYEELLRRYSNSKNVLRLGFVPDEDLARVYNLAALYVQPSYYEGFGIPVLEAMASETPVVVSKTNCLVEIAGGAALIADPYRPKDIAQKISEILNSENAAKKLVEAGKERIRDFSWEDTARGMLEIYRKVVESK